MATSRSGGSTQNNRESHSKRLGIKKFGGQVVKSGDILARQRGTKWHPGKNVGIGGDDTLYACASGTVVFHHKYKGRLCISVL